MRNFLQAIRIVSPGFLFLIPLIQSCMDDDTRREEIRPNLSAEEVMRERGVLILNEGNFMYGNSSLSYYNPVTGKVVNDVFYRQNGVPLGDVAQSAVIYGGELYVVLYNSGKIMVMNLGK